MAGVQTDRAPRRKGKAAAQNDALLDKLKEADELLQFPAVPGHVARASSLLLALARKAPSVAVRDAAMKAITLAGLLRAASPLSNDAANLRQLLSRIRADLRGEAD